MAETRSSHFKEIAVAITVALVAGSSAPWWWEKLFPPEPPTGGGGPPVSVCEDPSLALSQGSGPSGTAVVVRGSGYPSDESVTVRFHTETLPPARTTAEGTFEVDVVIPGTFDAFAPQQFDITATTSPTVCSDAAPFKLTA